MPPKKKPAAKSKKTKDISFIEGELYQDEKRLKKDLDKLEKEKRDLDSTEKEIRQLVHILKQTGFEDFVRYLRSPWRIIWTNFLGGIFRGLGIIAGMTIVFAILVWVLGQFVNFPLIGQFFLDIQNALKSFESINQVR